MGKKTEETGETNRVKVLYEDENYAILNKPAGLIVHSDGKTDEPSLSARVLKKYPETKGVGEPIRLSDGRIIERPGLVHRLDKETSGVIVIARNARAYGYLKKQFKQRKVRKTYLSYVYGKIKGEEGIIDNPIGRSRKFGLWSASGKLRGKVREALTEYKVLIRSPKATKIEVYPRTGRTHQIRVHLKHKSHPVICDKIYAPGRECLFGLKRLALHAKTIEFESFDGRKIKVSADEPPDFKEAEKELKSVAE